MRACLVIALVLIFGCDKKKSGEPSPQKPVAETDPVATKDPSPKPTAPAVCATYTAAVEKLKACPTVAADTKDTFLRIYEQDAEPISGKRPAPASALETLCAARLQNVQSVLASQCGAPLAERSVTEL